uniref:Uncharacterized protein n=1 Tax=Brassica campestris TaxID=3711 RepID=M4ENI5_BRACM
MEISLQKQIFNSGDKLFNSRQNQWAWIERFQATEFLPANSTNLCHDPISCPMLGILTPRKSKNHLSKVASKQILDFSRSKVWQRQMRDTQQSVGGTSLLYSVSLRFYSSYGVTNSVEEMFVCFMMEPCEVYDVIMDQLANGDDEDLDKPTDGDVLVLPQGPMTRSRSRKLTQVIGGLVKMSWKQEECLGRSLINQDTLITIQATSPSS